MKKSLATLVLASCTSTQPQLILQEPQPIEFPITSYEGACMATIDYDSDNDVDFLSADGSGDVYLWENNEGRVTRRNEPHITIPIKSYRGCAMAAVHSENSVKVFALGVKGNLEKYDLFEGNEQTPTPLNIFFPFQSYEGMCLGAADVNSDGHIDFFSSPGNGVVTLYTHDSNDRYFVNELPFSIPFRAYRGCAMGAEDFDQNGTIDLFALNLDAHVIVYLSGAKGF